MFSRIQSTWNFRRPRRGFILNPSIFHVRLKSTHLELSIQQAEILEALKSNNVIVSACPGSGKTATAKAVVKANPDSRVLILTYSKRLQWETKEKTAKYPNADVYTFHAFARKFFSVTVKDDHALRKLRARGAQPTWIPTYGFVIIDEVQDMTEILFWLTCTLLSTLARSLPTTPKVLLLGDPRQAIYGYQGADVRYLERGEHLFGEYSTDSWERRELSTSFRLSHETASFVNTFIGETYIEGYRNGPRPIYIRCGPWDKEGLAKEIVPIIEKYSPECCAILTPSVRNVPLAHLTNHLSTHCRVPVAEPTQEDGPLDPDVLRGKLAISTYHQFKGIDRDVVIVFGADRSYTRYIARNVPGNTCPNPIFVAITRAKTLLVVIQWSESALPFVPMEKLLDTCDSVELPYHLSPTPRPPRPLRVTSLIKHLPGEKLGLLIEKHLTIQEVEGPLPDSSCISIPAKVLTSRKEAYYESVRDLSGMAITAAFEWHIAGTCTLSDPPDENSLLDSPKPNTLTPQWFAKQAAKSSARQSHYISRLIALTKSGSYNWLSNCLRRTTKRLSRELPNGSSLTFEQAIKGNVEQGDSLFPSQYTHIIGYIDILEHSSVEGESPTIWEIKLVSSLTMEHVAQIVIYGFLWSAKKAQESRQKFKFPRLVLFNVRDGTKWEISTDFQGATAFTQGVLRARNTAHEGLSDDAFLERCRRVREEVVAAARGGG